MQYYNIESARNAFSKGENVTEHLRQQLGVSENSSEIIEIAYDLQAGSYIEYTKADPDFANSVADGYANVLRDWLRPNDTLLDVGTGEMTTYSLVLKRIISNLSKAYAFDISWSRVYKGIAFSKEILGKDFAKLRPFVADMKRIPLADKSVDITTSSHALEPNGGNLSILLSELFRVTRGKLILFEPSYETNSDEGKARMDKLGYIKGMDEVVRSLGGRVVDFKRMPTIANPLNPTACFIIEPPTINETKRVLNTDIFTLPGTSLLLEKHEGFFVSKESGLAFPVLKSIPVLKTDNAVLATALC